MYCFFHGIGLLGLNRFKGLNIVEKINKPFPDPFSVAEQRLI